MKIVAKAIQALSVLSIILLLCVANVNIFEALKFAGFVLIVLSSGYVLSRKMSCANSSEIYAFSIGFGMFFVCTVYMLFKTINCVPLYFIAIIFLAAYGVFCFYKDCKKDGLNQFKISNGLLTLIPIIIIISFFVLTLNNLSPELVGYGATHTDIMWNIGNINALKINFPPMDLRIAGEPFKYHLFAFLFRAAASVTTSIDTAKIFFVFSQFLTLPFMIFSIHSLGKRFLKSDRLALFLVVVFYFTGSASVLFPQSNMLFWGNLLHQDLMAFPNGIDFGIPFLMVGALLLIKTLTIDNTKWIYLGLFISTACCTLSKGPHGTVLFGATLGVVIVNLFLKQKRKAAVVSGVIVLIAFALTYLAFFSIDGTEENVVLLKFGDIVKQSGFSISFCEPLFEKGISLVELLFSIDLSGSTRLIPVLKQIYFVFYSAVYFVLDLIFVSIPYILFTVMQIFNFKKIKQEILVILGISCAGIVATYAFAVTGLGQIYFLFAALPFINLIALIWLESNFSKIKKPFKLFICLSFIVAVLSMQGTREYFDFINVGFNNLKACITKTANLEAEPTLATITKYEYEAMRWLNKNSDEHSVISTDRHYHIATPENYIPTVPNEYFSRYYFYSAYSGRQMFLEGWAYAERTQELIDKVAQMLLINNEIYNPNCSNREDLLRQNNISYIIVSRFINPDFEITDESLEKVFTNRDIDIYKLKG